MTEVICSCGNEMKENTGEINLKVDGIKYTINDVEHLSCDDCNLYAIQDREHRLISNAIRAAVNHSE